jgi:micrococcal nuclease|tara:strand:- start:1095 stop:1427 length:333 start_codon:yes stop_codon:yes gene_type:complete
MFQYNARLIRVIDGDTVDAMIDLGFSIWSKKRIRLFGINAPESRTRDLQEKKMGLAAKERLKELLEASKGEFTLISHGVGKYGRCLGTLLIDDENINELLISEGHAREYK